MKSIYQGFFYVKYKLINFSDQKNKNPPHFRRKKPQQNQNQAGDEAKKKPDIWFDDVDEMLLDPEDRAALRGQGTNDGTKAASSGDGLVKATAFKG